MKAKRRPLTEKVNKINATLRRGQSKLMGRRIMGIDAGKGGYNTNCVVRPIYLESWLHRDRNGGYREESRLKYGYDIQISGPLAQAMTGLYEAVMTELRVAEWEYQKRKNKAEKEFKKARKAKIIKEKKDAIAKRRKKQLLPQRAIELA